MSANLFAGIEGWTDQQKIELWGNMASRYLNLNMNQEARQYLEQAADFVPLRKKVERMDDKNVVSADGNEPAMVV